jgi:hypothetical protein
MAGRDKWSAPQLPMICQVHQVRGEAWQSCQFCRDQGELIPLADAIQTNTTMRYQLRKTG